MEQEIQSQLFRLSILVATSLTTLNERLGPNVIKDSSSQTSSKPAEELSAQIINDLKALFESVQKSSTNLTLALKPNKDQDDSKYKEKKSPIAEYCSYSNENYPWCIVERVTTIKCCLSLISPLPGFNCRKSNEFLFFIY